MTASIATVKKAALADFYKGLVRAHELKTRLVDNGSYEDGPLVYRRLPNYDKRDIAEFVFFEAASKFEHFALTSFTLAARSEFGLQPKRVQYVIGTIDRGLQGVMGWASPSHLKKRAAALFGANHFLSKLNVKLGTQDWEVLKHAHVMRNRVAHEGSRSAGEFAKSLSFFGVTGKARQGASVGRVLLEYSAPSGVQAFDAILNAYNTFALTVDKHLK